MLRRKHLRVAGHDGDGAELEAFRGVDGGQRKPAGDRGCAVDQGHVVLAGGLDRAAGTREFIEPSGDEDAGSLSARMPSGSRDSSQPGGDGVDLMVVGLEGADLGGPPGENAGGPRVRGRGNGQRCGTGGRGLSVRPGRSQAARFAAACSGAVRRVREAVEVCSGHVHSLWEGRNSHLGRWFTGKFMMHNPWTAHVQRIC